jgi:acyl-CoA reductase-like NAD-dependent aldehyde dehydrogenase
MEFSLLIDGALVKGPTEQGVINPATARVLTTAPRADEAQLNAAVAAAKRAFPGWAARPIEERRTRLLAFADAIEARLPQFASVLTAEQGKPIPEAQLEIGAALAMLRFTAGMDTPTRVLVENDSTKLIQHRTPLGVVAAITPWNFPVMLLMVKLAPSLITGNTVVAKPAPTTPLTGLLLGEVAVGILPAGVLNVIVGDNELGAMLAGHPDVSKIAFTGSTATGRKVMESAASSIKRLTLELGGNDVAIVLDDADIKQIAPKIFASAMMNAGQICVATKRVYAPRPLYDELCDELAKLADAAVVDDGAKQGTQIGPIQNRQQYEKLKGYLAEAHARGTVIAGGAPLDREGYFIPPTIVRDIPDDSRLVREEQFGPILPVLHYDDVADVIRRANDSEYGLGGSIWTSDCRRGVEVAMQIDTGAVWINKHLDMHFEASTSGAKQSGLGSELGQEGLEAYTQAKLIDVALRP